MPNPALVVPTDLEWGFAVPDMMKNVFRNLVETVNDLRAQFIAASSGAHYVTDVWANKSGSPPVADGAAMWAWLNDVKDKMNGHLSKSGGLVHYKSSNTGVTAADATDLATSITLANELKADINTHFTEGLASTVHLATPATAAVAAANASDEATLVTLVAEIQTKWNAHLVDAFLGVGALSQSSVDATNVTFA